jgi:hypothetical protein
LPMPLLSGPLRIYGYSRIIRRDGRGERRHGRVTREFERARFTVLRNTEHRT